MAAERHPIQNLPDNGLAASGLPAKNLKELMKSVVVSAEAGERRDLSQDLRGMLAFLGVGLKAEFFDKPDSSVPLIIAPNHHARRALFSTMESMAIVAISTVSAEDLDLIDNHTAWVIRKLDVHRFGPGILARKVQNATIVTMGSIPVVVDRKLKMRGFIPKFKETLANKSALAQLIAANVTDGNNIGFFPEQKPSHELQPCHPNFARFLDGFKFVADKFQILPLAIHYEDKSTARANFGPVITMDRQSPSDEAALLTMKRIARGLPSHLRGVYR